MQHRRHTPLLVGFCVGFTYRLKSQYPNYVAINYKKQLMFVYNSNYFISNSNSNSNSYYFLFVNKSSTYL